MNEKIRYVALANRKVFFLDYEGVEEKPIEWYIYPKYKSWEEFNFKYRGNKKYGTKEQELERKAYLDSRIYKKAIPMIEKYKKEHSAKNGGRE